MQSWAKHHNKFHNLATEFIEIPKNSCYFIQSLFFKILFWWFALGIATGMVHLLSWNCLIEEPCLQKDRKLFFSSDSPNNSIFSSLHTGTVIKFLSSVWKSLMQIFLFLLLMYYYYFSWCLSNKEKLLLQQKEVPMCCGNGMASITKVQRE